MQTARYLVALSCACASVACGTEVAVAVRPAPEGERPAQCNSPRIVDRLTYGRVPLPEGVRYRRAPQSYFGMPQDERIALARSKSNVTLVAWLNNAGTDVHVTPLAVTKTEIGRFSPDFVVPGTELSGLVAHDDGFAILTRRPDLGDPLGGNGTQAQATYLVRWQNAVGETFSVPLTGTSSITNADLSEKRDYPIGQSGRLAFNGTHYGAYFSARGFTRAATNDQRPNDRYAGQLGDKFVQVDDRGRLVNAWRMGCRQSLGSRLVAEASGFVMFCMSEGTIGDPGVNLVWGPFDAREGRHLAFEAAPSPEQEFGYAGGNFGSAVKTPAGYLVAWAARGVATPLDRDSPDALFQSHDVAVVTLNSSLEPTERDWPFLPPPRSEPASDVVNVHAAPYGNNVLVVWETIEKPEFRPGMMSNQGFSTGGYGGTHFRFLDAAGKEASKEEVVQRAIAPNGPDDIVQLSNGDLLWAYVPEQQRDFETLVTNVSNQPIIQEISFVRLLYCPP